MSDLELNIQISLENNNLFIGNNGSSGCEYECNTKSDVLQEICNYIADIVDDKCELKVTVYKNEKENK